MNEPWVVLIYFGKAYARTRERSDLSVDERSREREHLGGLVKLTGPDVPGFEPGGPYPGPEGVEVAHVGSSPVHSPGGKNELNFP